MRAWTKRVKPSRDDGLGSTLEASPLASSIALSTPRQPLLSASLVSFFTRHISRAQRIAIDDAPGASSFEFRHQTGSGDNNDHLTSVPENLNLNYEASKLSLMRSNGQIASVERDDLETSFKAPIPMIPSGVVPQAVENKPGNEQARVDGQTGFADGQQQTFDSGVLNNCGREPSVRSRSASICEVKKDELEQEEQSLGGVPSGDGSVSEQGGESFFHNNRQRSISSLTWTTEQSLYFLPALMTQQYELHPKPFWQKKQEEFSRSFNGRGVIVVPCSSPSVNVASQDLCYRYVISKEET